MSVVARWVNDYYLQPQVQEDIRQSVLVKPGTRYAVLDNFFRPDLLESLLAQHQQLAFSAEADRRGADGRWLPYDGAVVFAQPQHAGGELFFAAEWHRLLLFLTGCQLRRARTEVKLRWHRPRADGFWIHTDGTLRALVAICYFNRGWAASDGGLLQLWRPDEAMAAGVPVVENPQGRLDVLTQHVRLRTSSPGGGFRDRRPHDLVLVDQIVPVYNRLFLCNFQSDPAYHSITPSNGKARTGFVQWLMEANDG